MMSWWIFFAAGTTAQKIANFKALEETQRRVRVLLEVQKNETATPSELEELDDFLRLEHIMRLTKARAKQYANAG
jgi:hypothetical protein